MVCEFDQSLCGCSLKTGSKIIGFLSLVGSIIILTISVLALIGINNSKGTENLDHDQIVVLKAVLYTELISSTIVFLASVSLLYGVYEDHPGYMLPWLVMKTLSMVLLLIIIVVQLATPNVASKAIGNIITEVISVYLLLVVYNHYKALKRGGSLSHA